MPEYSLSISVGMLSSHPIGFYAQVGFTGQPERGKDR